MTISYNLISDYSRNRLALSVIIPVFNEREVLPQCLQRLQAVAKRLDVAVELLFVDDGSSDGSVEYLSAQLAMDASVRIVRLSRNFGKEAALTAGLDHCRGDAVVILDADLQDPPELIPDMVQKWHEGADVVLMQRRSRAGESWLKRASARQFYRILQCLSDSKIPLDTGDFRLMSRCAVEALKKLPERNRYMKGLFAWVGMPTVILKYDREPRAAGTSKWGYLSLLQLAMEGITSFSTSPLRWAMGLGVLAALIGAAFGALIVFKAVFFGDPVHGYPSLISVITFIGGMQLVAIGIVGEYVGKTYIEAKQRPNYLLQDVVQVRDVANINSSKLRRESIRV